MKRALVNLAGIVALVILAMVSTAKAQDSQVEDVAFCDLIDRAAEFSGKLVRTEAMVVGLRPDEFVFLFDPTCSDDRAVIGFRCDKEHPCAPAFVEMQKKRARKGTVSRVKVVIVGTIAVIPRPLPNTPTRSFRVEILESAERVPNDVPWPFE